MNAHQENQNLENAVEELDDDMLESISGGMRPAVAELQQIQIPWK